LIISSFESAVLLLELCDEVSVTVTEITTSLITMGIIYKLIESDTVPPTAPANKSSKPIGLKY
jgi:hypothetical protein